MSFVFVACHTNWNPQCKSVEFRWSTSVQVEFGDQLVFRWPWAVFNSLDPTHGNKPLQYLSNRQKIEMQFILFACVQFSWFVLTFQNTLFMTIKDLRQYNFCPNVDTTRIRFDRHMANTFVSVCHQKESKFARQADVPIFSRSTFCTPESLLCTDIYHLVSTLHSDEIFLRQFGILSKSAFRFDVRFLFSAKRFQQNARKLFSSGAVIVGASFGWVIVIFFWLNSSLVKLKAFVVFCGSILI